MSEIQNLSKHINFNNLTYYFKHERCPKSFIGFKGPLRFYKNIKDSYATLEKAEENKKEIKFQWNGNGKKKGGGVYKLIHRGWLKILTSKQMLQRLPIELACKSR